LIFSGMHLYMYIDLGTWAKIQSLSHRKVFDRSQQGNSLLISFIKLYFILSLPIFYKSLQDLKWGDFPLPLCHIIEKTWAVGSRIDGSDNPHATNTVHVGPTVCLGGTHVDSWDIRVAPHILVRGAHNSIMGFMVKNLCFLIL
jgi:hypothetical protein